MGGIFDCCENVLFLILIIIIIFLLFD